MTTTLIGEHDGNLPTDDTHPYRSGAWQPNHREYDATELEVEGEIPVGLRGVYLRNTENPLHDAIGRYHPFDGDGMLHSIVFDNGRVQYRNRFVATDGLVAEADAGRALWAGLMGTARAFRKSWLGRAHRAQGLIKHGCCRSQRPGSDQLLPMW